MLTYISFIGPPYISARMHVQTNRKSDVDYHFNFVTKWKDCLLFQVTGNHASETSDNILKTA